MSGRSVVVGTAGHIDHGKSALVRALTGIDPDRLKEERERGITIDLGFAHREVGDTTLSFVDVPGHERFVKNMLAGAGGIDLVMLVVAADESVMPQTREHFDICRLLDVRAGLIVLTKCDIADSDMQDLATLEVRELTAASFLAAAPIVRVSSTTGAGLADLTSALVQLSVMARRRPIDRPARLPIDRVFTVKGFGTVATGTLVAGRLAEGTEVAVLPRGSTVAVRGLHVHGAARREVAAGERVAVNLGGVEVSDVSRGDTLCSPGSIETTRRVDATIELLSSSRPLRHGARVRFHQGTTEVLGRVSVVGSLEDGGETLGSSDARGASLGEQQAGVVPSGAAAYARLKLEGPVVLTRGDRFIIRSYSPAVTIGGGVVLDPQPPRSAVRTEAGLRRFKALDLSLASRSRVVETLVGEQGASGLRRDALITRVGLSRTEADEIVACLCAAGSVVCIEALLLTQSTLDRLSEALYAAIQQHHTVHPLADGIPREEARERIFRRAAPAVFGHVLSRLVDAGRIIARERLALAGHQVSLSDEEMAALDVIEGLVKAARFAPPDISAAAPQAHLQADVADRMAKLLVRRNRLVRLEGMLFHTDVLEDLKKEVRAMRAAGIERIDVGTFKDRYGVSRKYAIPLLEYLDRERVTRRAGASRLILP
jgi:selenocysteine-specific elongation factor